MLENTSSVLLIVVFVWSHHENESFLLRAFLLHPLLSLLQLNLSSILFLNFQTRLLLHSLTKDVPSADLLPVCISLLNLSLLVHSMPLFLHLVSFLIRRLSSLLVHLEPASLLENIAPE